MDIVIRDKDNHAIIIENKIYTGDQWEQLKRYDAFAKNEYGDGNYQIFYLTLWGNEASEQSGQDVSYTCISYETDIIKWLEKCVCIAVHFPIVRETINQYINHLKSLTNQDMNTKNDKELICILSKKENLASVFSIAENLDGIRNYLINKIFLPQLTSICEDLGLKNTSEEYDRVNTSCAGFQIENHQWKYFKIGFEFEQRGLRQFIIGINHKDYKIRHDKTFEKLKQHFPKKNEKWVWKDFPTYTYWGKDAMIAIHNGTMADIFKKEIIKILNLVENLGMEM
jgi:hypothetical protein